MSAALHQERIEGDGALVVKVGVRDGGAVDLRLQERSLHVTSRPGPVGRGPGGSPSIVGIHCFSGSLRNHASLPPPSPSRSCSSASAAAMAMSAGGLEGWEALNEPAKPFEVQCLVWKDISPRPPLPERSWSSISGPPGVPPVYRNSRARGPAPAVAIQKGCRSPELQRKRRKERRRGVRAPEESSHSRSISATHSWTSTMSRRFPPNSSSTFERHPEPCASAVKAGSKCPA